MGGKSSKLKYNRRTVPHQEITVDEAVERIGMGRFQNLVLFATGTCFMADSVQVMLLSILTRKLQSEWEFDDAYVSVISSCLFLGASVGTLFLGPLGDRIGRKPILISAASIISCFGLMTSFITRYEMLYPIIFAVGFGIGGLTVPFDIMAEFLPMEPRGYYLLFIKYYWTAGSMLVPILAYVTLELFYSWRLFAAVCIIPVLLSLVFGVLFVPESPRWLVQRGKKEKALKILRKAAERNGKDPYEVFPIGMVLADEEQEHAEFKELFSPIWKKTVVKLGSLWMLYCFCFFGAIMIVARIFDETDDDNSPDFDYVAIFVSNAAELLGTFSAIMLIDRIGRVKTLVGGFVCAGTSLFILCLLSSVAPRDFLIGMATISRAAMMAVACVVWTVTAELLSTELLATGHSMMNSLARAGAFLSPYVTSEEVPFWCVGVIFLGVNFFSASTASSLPETKGVKLGQAVQIEHSKTLEMAKSQELGTDYDRMT